MAGMAVPAFRYEPDPEKPGWFIWGPAEPGSFNSLYESLRVRSEGDGRATVRMVPVKAHRNVFNVIHGGALVGFVDIALFAGPRAMGIKQVEGAVTIDLSTQFLSAGRLDMPLDAEVELLRLTRRFAFLRGLLVQDGTIVLSFAGTIRLPGKAQ